MSGPRKVSVLGAGAWGTALAVAAARPGNEVILWGRSPHQIRQLNETGINDRYLPGLALDNDIRATPDLAEAVGEAEIILLATPAQSASEIGAGIEAACRSDAIVVVCCKGIDRRTGHTPVELLSEGFGAMRIAVLSGPSFAQDVARGLPTAVTLAAEDMDMARQLSEALSSTQFRIYASDDPKGVELGGALKNVIALAVGATRAMELGASAEAALIARGFAEMSRFARAMGAKPTTISGLSGLGDLVLTCGGPQSRNFAYGAALGRGENLEGLKLAEGAFTAPIAAEIAAERKIDAPIIMAVAKVLAGELAPNQAVRRLLERPLRAEFE